MTARGRARKTLRGSRGPSQARSASLGPGNHCLTKKCPNEGTIYVNGWRCAAHAPKGDPACTHSLGSEYCAYCGGARPSEPV